MTKKEAIKIFDDKKVRTLWDTEKEQWCFSIVDVIAVLTEQNNYQGARNYWKVLKFRLLKEGNETVTNCNRLKLLAEDGKMRMTDVADTEQLFRLIQSIPSPKAEPFKQWLAQIASERLDGINGVRDQWGLTPLIHNAHISEIVIHQNKLRTVIDEIVTDLEGDIV